MSGTRARSVLAIAALLVAPLRARAQEVMPETAKPASKLSAPAPAKPKPAPKLLPKPAAKPAIAKVAKKGKPPRRPSPTLGAGAAHPTANDAARKRIAGGSTADAKNEKGDPELEALHDADRVLFPKPLPGSTSGWTWDLPKPVARSGTEVLASGLPPAPADPGLGDEVGDLSDAEWIRSLTLPDLPVRLESRVVRYLKFYRDNPKGRAIARVWAKKSGRYAPALKAELAKAGLPGDLVWLSLIESGHNPTIVSPAGAAGLWQFMPEAGRLYGLSVDRWVDERLDPKRETEAAVLYLSDLHRRFGSWELAMAAYNMGYAGLAKAIRKFNTNDYWELCRYEAGIPWETTLYVPKIFALAVVMANKKAFGLDDVNPDAAESFETVLAQPGMSLEHVAAAAEISVAALEALNPQLVSGRVPPGKNASGYRVRVPAGKAQLASEKLAKQSDPEPGLEPYTLRLGDTLAALAQARSSDEKQLRRLNHVKDDEALGSGTVILVPKRLVTASAEPSKADDVVVVPPREYRYPDRERVFYRVQSGDTLSKIAAAFDVAKSELEAWNSLDPSARLQSGMALQVFVRSGAAPSGVRLVRERDTRVLVAGTTDFFDYFEGLNGKKRITVEARAGDTLTAIGRRYGMSVGWMERINRRSRKKELRAGDKLVVYVPVGTAAAKAGALAPSEPEQLPDLEPSTSDVPAGDGSTPDGDADPTVSNPAAGG